jgi:hypothetical protein
MDKLFFDHFYQVSTHGGKMEQQVHHPRNRPELNSAPVYAAENANDSPYLIESAVIPNLDPGIEIELPSVRDREWNKKKKGGFAGYELSDEQKAENKRQMDLVIKALDITWSKQKRKLTGTKALSDGSLKAYDKHYRGLRHFLTLIGDFKSMLILQEDAPDSLCPSVNAQSISLYYRWKLLPKGTQIDGLALLSTGSWKDPKNMDQFRAAMVALHKSRGQGGVYQEPCERCLLKYDGLLGSESFEYRGGCRQHPSNPALWLTGNPVTSSVVEDCCDQLFRIHSTWQREIRR